MDHFDQRFRSLLSQLLDGVLTADESSELARLCESNPERAEILRRELEMAELIRHAAAGGVEGATPLSPRVDALIGREPVGEFDDLVDLLLVGELDEAGMDQLARHCWRDEATASALRRALRQEDLLQQAALPSRSPEAFVEALETRMWAEQDEDHFVDDVASTIVQMHPDLPPSPESSVGSRRRGEHSGFAYLGGWAAAAAAVIGLIAAMMFQPVPSAPMRSVAEVGRTSGEVRWRGDAAPVQSQYVVPGRYALESGVVTIDFESGAEMTVEGPAEFHVYSEHEALVFSGLAILSNSALAEAGNRRFRLRSEALDLGESGHTVGLIASSASSAEAVVFDGDARVCMPEMGACREVFALEPVRADLDREKLFDIPYNPGVFARAWELNSGVALNNGPVRLEMPGSQPESAESDGEVQVFVERNRFVADRDIEVDTLDPGHFAAVSPGGGRKLISDGREFRSYLLQLRPDGSLADEAVEASVTFDHEIVGVIYSPNRLADSDSLVGANPGSLEGEDAQARGLDADTTDGGEQGDRILLSDDRRTVDLKLHSGGADRVDHVRVLVALN